MIQLNFIQSTARYHSSHSYHILHSQLCWPGTTPLLYSPFKRKSVSGKTI